MAARILVADDSVTIQKVVELTFSKEDFVLVQARSGEEAIRKAKEQRPDLVLLDFVMPDKNGYEVCAALRAEPMLRAVPIILLTGTFEAFDKDKGIQAGANDFVTKPFESQVLISKVKQLLFTKTVDLAPTAAPAGPAKAVPPKEVPRPAPTKAASPPPGIPPRPSPAPGPSRGVAPGAMRGAVPPPAPTPPLRPGVVPSGPAGMPTPSTAGRGPAPVGQPPPRPAPAKTAPASPAPTMAAVPPERPVPGGQVPPPPTVPPRVGRTLELSPPSEEISQDRVRSVVEPPPGSSPSGAPGGLGELGLGDLATLPLPEQTGGPADLHQALEGAASAPAPGPEELSLEMPSLVPELDQRAQAPPGPEVGESALPESLSLDDLLSAEGTGATPSTESAPVSLEELPGGPVFDLTSEMSGPSLPLVEVGTGEAPALSIEDLLASAGAAPSPTGEVPTLEFLTPGQETPTEESTSGPVFDLTNAAELSSPPLVDMGAGEHSDLSVEDLLPPRQTSAAEGGMLGLRDLDLDLDTGPVAAAGPATEPPPAAAPSLDLGAPAELPVTTDQPVSQVAPPPVVPPAVPGMVAGVVPAAGPAAAELPPAAAAMRRLGGGEALAPEMAAVREQVTERVAHELAHDLSDKLLERIERIVWEVVPDLAEILITKEIERIRAQAEGKQSS